MHNYEHVCIWAHTGVYNMAVQAHRDYLVSGAGNFDGYKYFLSLSLHHKIFGNSFVVQKQTAKQRFVSECV